MSLGCWPQTTLFFKRKWKLKMSWNLLMLYSKWSHSAQTCHSSFLSFIPPLLSGDAPGLVDIGVVETCAGGSAVLPCLPPNGDGLPVEGVILKRRRGLAPVEVLYHSKHQHGSSPPFSSSYQFPADKVRLSSAPGPGGFTFNLTLLQLQPEDSGLYSCQLLLRGRPDSSTSLGRQVFSLSVQGGSQWGLMARLTNQIH